MLQPDLKLAQNPPLHVTALLPVRQFVVSAVQDSLEPYLYDPPAGFEDMLPDRSRTMRASGEVDVVKRASSPATGCWAFAVPEKRISKPVIRKKYPIFLKFMEPPYRDMVEISMGP
jgi:hypothetical protein